MNTSQRYHAALDLHRNGKFAEAEAQYRQLLAQAPRHADALHYLGVVCHQTARHHEAIELIAAAVKLDPLNADYLNNHGLALRAAGRVDEAIASYLAAIALTPHDMDLHNNLGNAYQQIGWYEQAAGCYRRVLRAYPKEADVMQALCHALQSLGRQSHEAGRYTQAEACYSEVLQYRGQDAALHYNLGNALRELGRPAEAVASYSKALKLAPDDADIHNNLGNVLRELGRLDEAIACYERALKLAPALYHAQAHLVHQRQHVCDWRTLAQDTQRLRDWVKHVPQAQISPFAFLALPGSSPQEQRQCATNWNANRYANLTEAAQTQPSAHCHAPGDKLRIGYLSSDFRLHPLAFLITELIELHDRSQFEIYAYSYAADDKTAERKRLERAFDHFVDIQPMSLIEAAKRVNDDQIDILVDLTGHTQSSRSGIAALRPAPIQVNWLGYPGSMGELHGRPLFDYLLSDGFITPPHAEADYAERLMRLPDGYQPNNRSRPQAAMPTRAQCGLPQQAFVFCCFNQTFKITPPVFAIWMRLLAGVPDSVLWLLECNRWARENLRREAEQAGIAAERLVFAARLPIDQHLARHALADLFVDTLPYNAHTTASDALWMGLPLLTCVGDTFAGRVAGSLLTAGQLPQLITHSLAEYETRALQLARAPAALKAMRNQLLQNRDRLPLFDTARFAANLETAYRHMWQTHAARASSQP